MHNGTKETEGEEITLPARSELRIQTEKGCKIALKSGMAEIFGAELPLDRVFEFGPMTNLAVTTFHGADVRVDNLDPIEDDIYITTDLDAVKSYMRVHRILDNVRKLAEGQRDYRGPTVVIVGPRGTGKSSLWRMLCNWACRIDYQPIYCPSLACFHWSICFPLVRISSPVS
ncbi:hypothetical protein ACOME3_002253 [Neoechinorhynchus agilis]